MLKLSFIYAYPLDVSCRRLFQEKGIGDYPSIDEIKKTITHWESIWEDLDKDGQVIKTLMNMTKRTPTRSLECFVFGGGFTPMSTPFLLPIMGRGNVIRSDKSFVQTLLHELLHIFVSTNNEDYWIFIRKKYVDENTLVQNHIIIYAMLYELYKILFNHIPPDFSNIDLPQDYIRAIEIVKESGHTSILKEYNNLV